jgi:hypothetical protein
MFSAVICASRFLHIQFTHGKNLAFPYVLNSAGADLGQSNHGITHSSPQVGQRASCRVAITDLSSLDRTTLGEWDNLSRESEYPNPYFSPWFLRPALKWLDPEKAVHLMLFRDEQTDTLHGVIPVVAGSTYARLPLRHLAVWKNNHLYNGTPLIRMGYARQTMNALVDWIGTCPMGIRFLRFTQLAADGPIYHALTAACSDRSRDMFFQSRLSRPVLRAGHDFDTLLSASQSAKQRAELRRRIKRFGETGAVTLEENPLTPQAAPALCDAFIQMENAGWKKDGEDGFALAKSDAEQQFFKEVMRNAAEHGQAIATVLSRDSEPVAISLSLRDQDMQFGFKTAFDLDHAKASPGIQLFHETTRRATAAKDISLYDSCAVPGHSVLDKFWPDRLDYVQVNIPARGKKNTHLVRFAAHAEALKGHWATKK